MKSHLSFILICLLSWVSIQQSHAQTASQLLKDLEILSSDKFEGRKTGTKGAELARAYLTERFKQIGLLSFGSSFRQAFTFRDNKNAEVKGINMIGYLPGKTDRVMVISAHYDHLGIIDNKVFNGADDNASGVAGLLYLAEYFTKNKPDHTLIFAAFDAEEMGLRGARAFVAHPPVNLNRIRLNVNMDMIAHNDKGELYVCGTLKYPEFKKYFITENPNLKVLFGHDDPKSGHDDWTSQSDHAEFNAKNIPFLYFGVEDHKDYHQASDKFENISRAFFIDAADAIKTIVSNIDKGRSSQKIFREKLKMKKQ